MACRSAGGCAWGRCAGAPAVDRDESIALLYGHWRAREPREIEPAPPAMRTGSTTWELGRYRRSPRRRQCQAPERGIGALFAYLVAQAGRGLRRKIGEAVHLIIDGTATERAQRRLGAFLDGVCGVKLHIVSDCDAERPIDAVITPPLSTTSPRRGPVDCSGCDLCLRPRPLRLCLVGQARRRRLPHLAASNPYRSHRRWREPRQQGWPDPVRPHRLPRGEPHQPFQAPVREIRVRIESGKILRILSNDIDGTADEIAALYKRRW